MIRVGEDDFRAELFERFLGEGFDGGLRAHRHEKRSLDAAVGRRQAATSRAGRVGFCYFKRKTHTPSLSEENPRNHGEDQDKRESRSKGNSERRPNRRYLWFRSGETNHH